MAQTANPTRRQLIPKRREIASQMLLELTSLIQEQRLIEVALNKAFGKRSSASVMFQRESIPTPANRPAVKSESRK